MQKHDEKALLDRGKTIIASPGASVKDFCDFHGKFLFNINVIPHDWRGQGKKNKAKVQKVLSFFCRICYDYMVYSITAACG